MTSIVYLAVILAAAQPEIRLEETGSTRIFVQTVPPGAQVVLDGKPLGQTDILVLVPPGVRKISLELDGYQPEVHEVEVPKGWITRVEFQLQTVGRGSPDPAHPSDETVGRGSPDPAHPSGETVGRGSPDPAHPALEERLSTPPNTHDDSSAAQAARLWIGSTELPAPMRQAMQTVLDQHPTQSRWSGRSGSSLFALAAQRLPTGEIRDRSVPPMLGLVHVQATHELLKAKSLLGRFSETGLDDATTLRRAVEEAAGELRVMGRVQGVVHRAAAVDGFAVGYVVADESTLSAFLMQPSELQVVQAAYRDVMHRQARQLMERSDWQNALLLWRHLHQRKLVSQPLYLDAARCFLKLGQIDDTIRVLSEALTAFGDSGSPEFFEQAGDLVFEIETDEAQSLAEAAYRKASDALRETVSGLSERRSPWTDANLDD